MPVTWDDATDKKFLLNIINVLAPQSLPWPTICDSMGEEFTMESVKSRYKKLKQQAKAQFGDMPAGGDGTPAKATPARGKGKKADGEKSTGTKRKSKKALEEENGAAEDEDDVEATPSKKQKIKKEESAEQDDGELV